MPGKLSLCAKMSERIIVNFLFNAHPRAATTASGKRTVLSLAIIDACGKSYTAIAKEVDVAKSTMTLL